MAVDRKKTSMYLDPQLVKAVKVIALTSGRNDYEVIEDALREYVGSPSAKDAHERLGALLKSFRKRPASKQLTESQAMKLANAEVKAVRAVRKTRKSA